jgi:hypothetical protein
MKPESMQRELAAGSTDVCTDVSFPMVGTAANGSPGKPSNFEADIEFSEDGGF